MLKTGSTLNREVKRYQGAWPNPSFNELRKTDYYSNLGVEVRKDLGPIGPRNKYPNIQIHRDINQAHTLKPLTYELFIAQN